MNVLWELLTQTDAENALRRLLDPAWLFWLLGTALALLAAGRAANTLLTGIAAVSPGWTLFLGVLVITLVMFSAQAMRWAEETLLRTLEGYGWPGWLRRWFLARQQRTRAALLRNLVTLEAQVKVALREGNLGLDLAERYAQADLARYTLPQGFLLPTRLGNLLRAAEEYVELRYGLNAVLVWPRLWLLLPQEARETLARGYQRLVAAARAWGWGLAFLLVWTPVTAGLAWRFGRGWAWLCPLTAIAVGWAWMGLAYRLAVTRAAAFGELVRAAFDLHRLRLYDALGWPRPALEEEPQAGQRLTAFLWRGMQVSSRPDAAQQD